MRTQNQIDDIATLLNTLDIDSTNILVPVYTQYTANPTQYPYVFITDGAVKYEDIDFQTYRVMRQYKISIVCQLIEPNEEGVRIVEDNLRELLNKCEDLLKIKSSRNNSWQDIKLISTSEPFNGSEVAFSENTIIREIIVEVEDTESI